MTTTALSTNGMRQPQDLKASSDSSIDMGRKIAAPRICPATVPCRAKLARKPRLPCGACSMIIALAPLNSPATAKPCTRRTRVRRIGAMMPTWLYVGSSATTNVETPIRSMARTRTFLRPFLSPQWPSTAAPMGRAT